MKKKSKKESRFVGTDLKTKNHKPSIAKQNYNIAKALALVIIISFISFYPSINNDFTNWDDPAYVRDNNNIKSLSKENIKKFFTESAISNYHPLTMLSLAIDYHFTKKELKNNEITISAKTFHITSIIFHLLNTILVFLFIYLLTGKKILIAFITSLLFGIHPMHVESVTWIAERKDVLYTFFYFGALITYLKYVNTKKLKFYLFTVILFMLSLLSKPAAVTLPVILLLIDFYIGRSFNIKVILDKILFFALAITLGMITFMVQSDKAVADFETFTVFQRVMFASYGFIMYIYKMVIPIKLSAFYPYPFLDEKGYIPLTFYISPIVVLIIAVLAFLSRKKTKVVIFGLLFYFFTVALVLQFISVGRAIMADRYTYMPYIGLLFIIGYYYDYISGRKEKIYKNLKYLFLVALIVYIPLMSYLTYERTKVWKNSETLWTDVIKNYPQVEIAYKNRGNYYANELDEPDKALKDYNVLVAMKSKDAAVYSNLGNIYGLRKEYDKSLNAYSKSIELDSNRFDAYLNMAITYSMMKEYEKAFNNYDKAIKLNQNSLKLYTNRAYAYSEYGDFEKSIADYDYLLNKKPDDAVSYFYRGLAKFRSDNYQGALEDFMYNIRLNPNNKDTYFNISVSYFKMNQHNKAMEYALKAQSMGYNVSDSYLKQIIPNRHKSR